MNIFLRANLRHDPTGPCHRAQSHASKYSQPEACTLCSPPKCSFKQVKKKLISRWVWYLLIKLAKRNGLTLMYKKSNTKIPQHFFDPFKVPTLVWITPCLNLAFNSLRWQSLPPLIPPQHKRVRTCRWIFWLNLTRIQAEWYPVVQRPLVGARCPPPHLKSNHFKRSLKTIH